jgi:hypothetical protein
MAAGISHRYLLGFFQLTVDFAVRPTAPGSRGGHGIVLLHNIQYVKLLPNSI